MADSSSFIKNLLKRSLSGAVIAIVILTGIAVGGYLWSSIVFLIAMISLKEYYNIISRRLKVSTNLGLILGAILLVAVICDVQPYTFIGMLPLFVFFVLAVEMVRKQISGSSTAIEDVSGIISGLVYIILPWTFAIILRNSPSGKIIVFAIFMCTWSCDVFAYFVGSRFGRHKLCEQISPKKTWEGFCSGAAGSFLAAALIAYLYGFPPLPLVIIGLVCGIAGQMGDLEESIIKREGKVKDSGNLIPGHGGMLDRFDSILISMAIIFFTFEVIWR